MNRKELSCLVKMPKLKHKVTGIFNIMDSEVVAWMTEQPEIRNLLYKIAMESKLIKRDSEGFYSPIAETMEEAVEIINENKISKHDEMLEQNRTNKVQSMESIIAKNFRIFPEQGIRKVELLRMMKKVHKKITLMTIDSWLSWSQNFYWDVQKKRVLRTDSKTAADRAKQEKFSIKWIQEHYLVYLKPGDKMSLRRIELRAGEGFRGSLENLELAIANQSRFQWVDDEHDLFRDTQKQEVESDEDYGEF